MSKSRTKRGNKDFDQLDRLKHENSKLKRELSQLRKQFDRVNFERFQNLKDLVDKQEKVAAKELEAVKKDKLKEKWKCFDCGKGVLELKIYSNPSGQYYYRCCNICGKRTQSQKYNNNVEGVISEES